MFEVQSPKTWEVQEKIGSTLEQMQVPMGQDQVSGWVSVLCWLATTDAMLYGNLNKFCNKVKNGNNVHFCNKCTNWFNVLSTEVSLYIVMSQNVM